MNLMQKVHDYFQIISLMISMNSSKRW